MTTPSAKLLVHVGSESACIKIVGRANFTSSLDFKTLVTELSHKGFAYFVVDLTECLLMDSTFLGMLAGLGLKMNGIDPGRSARAVELLNPNERIAELLENLGILDLFKIELGPRPAAAAQEICAPTAEHSRAEVTRACLEAHRTLIEVNPENATKFKEVAQFLAEDLKKLEKR